MWSRPVARSLRLDVERSSGLQPDLVTFGTRRITGSHDATRCSDRGGPHLRNTQEPQVCTTGMFLGPFRPLDQARPGRHPSRIQSEIRRNHVACIARTPASARTRWQVCPRRTRAQGRLHREAGKQAERFLASTSVIAFRLLRITTGVWCRVTDGASNQQLVDAGATG